MNETTPQLPIPPLTSFSDPTIWIAIASIVVYLLGKFIARRNERTDNQKRKAIQLAGDVRLAGLDFLAPMLEDYAVGDEAALTQRIEALAQELSKDSARKTLVDRLFQSQLAERLRDSESRRRIVRQLDQTKPAA